MDQIVRCCHVLPNRRKRRRTLKLPDDDLINIKRRERRERSKIVNEHGATIEIPLDLYEAIMKANTFRKQLEADPDDKHSQSMLNSCEVQISIFVDYYKDIKVLPRHWKYDPATASTLVPKKSLTITDNDIIISDSPKRHDANKVSAGLLGLRPNSKGYNVYAVRGCICIQFGFSLPPYNPLDPNQKCPNTEVVPLDDEGKKIWLQFLDFAKKRPALISISLGHSEKEKRPIPLDHPIVGLIGNFAVDTFNEAFEMFIKEGEHNRVQCIEFLKCTYIKMTGIYYFYLTIMACEEGNVGVYETKVVCESDDGNRTLSHFVLTYPPSEAGDSCSDHEDDSCSDSEDDWSDPEDKLSIRGMELRRKDATCRGYDYYTPFGFDGP